MFLWCVLSRYSIVSTLSVLRRSIAGRAYPAAGASSRKRPPTFRVREVLENEDEPSRTNSGRAVVNWPNSSLRHHRVCGSAISAAARPAFRCEDDGVELYAVAHRDHRFRSVNATRVPSRLFCDLFRLDSDAPCRHIMPVTRPALSRRNSALATGAFRKTCSPPKRILRSGPGSRPAGRIFSFAEKRENRPAQIFGVLICPTKASNAAGLSLSQRGQGGRRLLRRDARPQQ